VSVAVTSGARTPSTGLRAEQAVAPPVVQVSVPAPVALPDEDAASASFAAPDDDVPIGPSEEEESAYLAEEAASGYGRGAGFASELSVAEGEPEATFAGPLPSLAALQEKIPPTTLALIDELFRAKFTRVQRVHAKDLKS